jgi:hypothetical protein
VIHPHIVRIRAWSQNKTLSIPASCRFFIRKTDEISRNLRWTLDGISFDKILPKVGNFGTRIN